MSETGETQTENPETQPAPESPQRQGAGDDGAWSAAALSADQADALASRFRASWETDPEPAPAAPTAAAQATASRPADRWTAATAPIAGAALGASAGTAQAAQAQAQARAPSAAASPRRRAYSSEAELPALPVAKSNRVLLFGAIGLVGVVGVLVLSLSLSGRSSHAATPSRDIGRATPEPTTDPAPSTDPAAALAEPVAVPAPTPAAPVPAVPTPAPVAVAPTPVPTTAPVPVPVPAPVAAVVAPPVVAPVPVPVAPPPPPMVRVRLRAAPSSAQVSLDGARVSNPYDTRLAQGGTHRVDVTADGFTPVTRTVSFGRDVNETIELARAPVAAAPTPRAQPRRPRPRPRPAARPRTPRGAGFVTDNPY